MGLKKNIIPKAQNEKKKKMGNINPRPQNEKKKNLQSRFVTPTGSKGSPPHELGQVHVEGLSSQFVTSWD